MSRTHILQRCAWSHSARTAVVAFAVATLTVDPALASPPTQQFGDFYYPDGTPVVNDGGMPFVHAALFRYADRQQSRIMWQLMTQGLTPGASYDIWIEGSDGGTDSGAFRWWVGGARATRRGDLDAIGLVYTNMPPGASSGSFTNAGAPLYLVITTADGDEAQSAFFPAP